MLKTLLLINAATLGVGIVILWQLKEVKQIMADVKQQLIDAKTTIDAMTVQVGKIGTETDGLEAKIDQLQATIDNAPAGSIPQDVVDAAAALDESLTALKTAITGVDDKVQDASTPTDPTDPGAPVEP